MRKLRVAFVMLFFVAGCGGSPGKKGSIDTAADVAAAIKQNVSQVSKTVKITEDNDPNNAIGRPNQYTAAVSIYDSRVKCDSELDVTCGAKIEEWSSESAAKNRSKYIQALQKASPLLGSEYDVVRGKLVLRISGKIKPSQVGPYKTAFAGGTVSKAQASAADAAAGPTDDPTAATLKASGFGQTDQYAWVTAIVHNDSKSVGQTVTVHFDAVDASGRLLKSEDQVESFSRPGEDLIIGTQLDVGQGNRVASIKATPEVEDDDAFSSTPAAELPLSAQEVRRGEFGGWTFHFELTNPTKTPVKDPRIGIACFDEAGKVIGGSAEYPELIPAASKVAVDSDVTTSGRPARCTANAGTLG